ncbi:MAG: hypothetical protein LBS90_06580 [Oscillospiraceae bacterium]|jgi:hypothetical protein|nr:hypothetical protein [Oscillospiraceae bacterium]
MNETDNRESAYLDAAAKRDEAELADSVSATAKEKKALLLSEAAAAFGALGDYKDSAKAAESLRADAAVWAEKAAVNTKKEARLNEMKRSGAGSAAYLAFNKLGRFKVIGRVITIIVIILLLAFFVFLLNPSWMPNKQIKG